MTNRIPAAVQRSGAATQRLTAAVLEHYGAACWLKLPGCRRLATTKDHVIPVDHGGTDDMENLRPACQPCNSMRRNLAISGIGGISVTVLVGPVPRLLDDRASQLMTDDTVLVAESRIAAALGIEWPTRSRAHAAIVSRAFRSAADAALRSPGRFPVVVCWPVPDQKRLQVWARLRYDVQAVVNDTATNGRGDARDDDELRAATRWATTYPDGVASVERMKTNRRATEAEAAPAASVSVPLRKW